VRSRFAVITVDFNLTEKLELNPMLADARNATTTPPDTYPVVVVVGTSGLIALNWA